MPTPKNAYIPKKFFGHFTLQGTTRNMYFSGRAKEYKTMTLQKLKEWPYIKLEIARLDKIIMSLEERFCKSGANWLIKDIVDNKNKRLSLLEEIQEIIRYRYEDRLSWQEIADKIGEGVTADSVKQAHYRCLKNINCRFQSKTSVT